MSAILTEEQRALQETAAAYLAQHANAREGRDGDQALWQGIAELGWTAPWYLVSALGREGTWPIMKDVMAFFDRQREEQAEADGA